MSSLSKNTLSFFLRLVIVDADALWESSSPRAHSIRGVATSAACFRTGRSQRWSSFYQSVGSAFSCVDACFFMVLDN